ncbi:MAG TPA: SLC13 family permease [Dehalococcoidales bacterium]|nr:SLC13 family permease [Dehalococcoidales bacterium]
MLSIVILALVFILIAVRRIGKFRFQIWQVMLLGAAAVLITRQISPLDALKAINVDVMFFLFGMFVVGQALEESGYLAHVSYKIFRRARSLDLLLLGIFFIIGFAAAFLMNDTLAIIGTPVMLILARQANVKSKILLLSLAFAITIGSVMSPIGNPQNLLVAVNGNITNPFITFFKYLFLPTVINLFVAYFFIRLYYQDDFRAREISYEPEPIKDTKLATLTKISLIILLVAIVVKIVLVFAAASINFPLTYIGLAAALPLVVFSPKRLSIIKNIDWFTLVFFAAMFILMQSVWNSGVIQGLMKNSNTNMTSSGAIMQGSVVASQFISNVPLVALYLPVLEQSLVTTKGLMALAAGSTIAGNLSILGAASNVIIIQNAEKKARVTISFWEFIKIGLPLTVVNTLVYWLFLR